jgi:hypothetical protein
VTLADQARKIPGVAAAERALNSVRTTEHDLPIADYDNVTARNIIAKLKMVSQHDLRMLGAYEAKHANRVTITNRIATLTGTEPWSGYDEQNSAEITAALAAHDAHTASDVRSYERRHKNRADVIAALATHAGRK